MIGRHSEVVYHRESVAYGFYTFAPLFKLMGSHRVLPLGIFDEDYSYGDLLITNIFTMFRGLIQDFGFIGTVLFMVATGMLLHWAFHAMLLKRMPVFTVAVFVFMIGCFYMSFGISLLIWNSIYVTFVFIWIVLQLNKLITERGGRRLAPQEAAFWCGAVSAVIAFTDLGTVRVKTINRSEVKNMRGPVGSRLDG